MGDLSGIAHLISNPPPNGSQPSASLGPDPGKQLREDAERFGLAVRSGVRTRAQQDALIRQGRTRARNSYHLYQGQTGALDFVGPVGRRREFADYLHTQYGDQLAELFHENKAFKHGSPVRPVSGHGTHLHVAWGGRSAVGRGDAPGQEPDLSGIAHLISPAADQGLQTEQPGQTDRTVPSTVADPDLSGISHLIEPAKTRQDAPGEAISAKPDGQGLPGPYGSPTSKRYAQAYVSGFHPDLYTDLARMTGLSEEEGGESKRLPAFGGPQPGFPAISGEQLDLQRAFHPPDQGFAHPADPQTKGEAINRLSEIKRAAKRLRRYIGEVPDDAAGEPGPLAETVINRLLKPESERIIAMTPNLPSGKGRKSTAEPAAEGIPAGSASSGGPAPIRTGVTENVDISAGPAGPEVTEEQAYREWFKAAHPDPDDPHAPVTDQQLVDFWAGYYNEHFPRGDHAYWINRPGPEGHPAVTVNLGTMAQPPSVRELSGLIATEMGFTPEEAKEYERVSGRNPFYSDVRDEKAAMASVFNRRDPETGQVAIPFTERGAEQRAHDWLRRYRAEEAEGKIQKMLAEYAAMSDTDKQDVRSGIASRRPLMPEEDEALETQFEKDLARDNPEAYASLKAGQAMISGSAGMMKGSAQITAGLGRILGKGPLGRVLSWAGNQSAENMDYISRRYGLPAKGGERVSGLGAVVPDIVIGEGPVGIGAVSAVRAYGAGASGKEAAIQGAINAIALKVGLTALRRVLTPAVQRLFEASTPEQLRLFEDEVSNIKTLGRGPGGAGSGGGPGEAEPTLGEINRAMKSLGAGGTARPAEETGAGAEKNLGPAQIDTPIDEPFGTGEPGPRSLGPATTPQRDLEIGRSGPALLPDSVAAEEGGQRVIAMVDTSGRTVTRVVDSPAFETDASSIDAILRGFEGRIRTPEARELMEAVLRQARESNLVGELAEEAGGLRPRVQSVKGKLQDLWERAASRLGVADPLPTEDLNLAATSLLAGQTGRPQEQAKTLGAAKQDLVSDVKRLVDRGTGGLTRGLDVVRSRLHGEPDTALVDLLRWSRSEEASPFVRRFVPGTWFGIENVEAELRARGVPVDDADWQQKNLKGGIEDARKGKIHTEGGPPDRAHQEAVRTAGPNPERGGVEGLRDRPESTEGAREAASSTATAQEVASPQKTAAEYDFASTQADLPDSPVRRKILSFARLVKTEDLAEDGRETEPHITVKYGLHGEDPEPVRRLLAEQGPITVTLGKTSVFPAKTGQNFDVVKIDVDSPELHALNAKIEGKLPQTQTQPEYEPHITIAYVKPGEGQKYAGRTLFEGKQVTLNSIAFSDRTGKKTDIALQSEQRRQPPTAQVAEQEPVPREVAETIPPTDIPRETAVISQAARQAAAPVLRTALSGTTAAHRAFRAAVDRLDSGDVSERAITDFHAAAEKAGIPKEAAAHIEDLARRRAHQAPFASAIRQTDTAPRVTNRAAQRGTFQWREKRQYLAIDAVAAETLKALLGYEFRGVAMTRPIALVYAGMAETKARDLEDWLRYAGALGQDAEVENFRALAAALRDAAGRAEEFAITAEPGLGGRRVLRHEAAHVAQFAIERFFQAAPPASAYAGLPHYERVAQALQQRSAAYQGDELDPRFLAHEGFAHITTGYTLGLKMRQQAEFIDGYLSLIAQTYRANALTRFDSLIGHWRAVRDAIQQRAETAEIAAASGYARPAATDVQGVAAGRQEGRPEQPFASAVEAPRSLWDAIAEDFGIEPDIIKRVKREFAPTEIREAPAREGMLPGQRARVKPTDSLGSFVWKMGGLRLDETLRGETGWLRQSKMGSRPGFFSKTGKPFDIMREVATQAGYGPYPDINDFLADLEAEARGQPVHSMADEEIADSYERELEGLAEKDPDIAMQRDAIMAENPTHDQARFVAALNALGYDPSEAPDEQRREYRQAARALGISEAAVSSYLANDISFNFGANAEAEAISGAAGDEEADRVGAPEAEAHARLTTDEGGAFATRPIAPAKAPSHQTGRALLAPGMRADVKPGPIKDRISTSDPAVQMTPAQARDALKKLDARTAEEVKRGRAISRNCIETGGRFTIIP